MMNVQAAEAYPIYQCYVCYLDRENFAVKDFKTGPKLISHMRTAHAFVLESRSRGFRRTQFVGNFVFLDFIPADRQVERRLCCPSCGYNTNMDNHDGLYLHYYGRNHVQQRGDAPRPDTIVALPQHAAVIAAQPQTARPQPAQRIALPQAHQEQQAPDLTDEEVIEETTRRGWHWDDIGLGQSRQAWLDYARHGNPAFIRRRPDWNLWVVELYIRNNHPDDDINPDFIEELEDADQD